MSQTTVEKIVAFDGICPTLINLAVHEDNRGSFAELWNVRAAGFDAVQSNLSVNKKVGTFRGMHFQVFLPQSKLVSVITGGIVDYVVDIRPRSKTFGKFASFELTQGQSLRVPNGYAHGFLTTQDNTIVNYLVDGSRFPQHERVINPLDAQIQSVTSNNLNLLMDIHQKVSDLGLSLSDLIMSEKDSYAESLESLLQKEYNNFTHCIGTDLT